MTFRAHDWIRHPLVWLLLASAAIKLAYVFWFTQYPDYLFSDFRGYWDRALERLAGRDSSFNQWAIWPALPHILLAWYFRLLEVFGLGAVRLQAVVVANVFFSTLNVALVYGVAHVIVGRRGWALAAAALYAFTFPLIYFNAFVMSEHPAACALLLAMWLAMRFPLHLWVLLGAGMLFGLAVGMRPAFGPYGLVFLGYLVAIRRMSPGALKRAMVFTVGAALVMAAVVAENYRISEGRLKGISANGGVNFYFAHCRTHRVISTHDGYLYTLIPPPTVNRPENGVVSVERPFYDQSFFYDLGWRCLREQTEYWTANLEKFSNLFLGPLLPTVQSAKWFGVLMPAFQWLFVIVALILPLVILVWRDRSVRAEIEFIVALLVISVLTMWFFNVEHRYLYPLLAPAYILLIAILHSVSSEWRRSRRVVSVYAVMLLLLWVGMYVKGEWARNSILPNISVDVIPNRLPLSRLPEHVSKQPAWSFVVDTLRFPEGEVLQHSVLGDLGRIEHTILRLVTCMEIEEAGQFEFQVASDDGFALFIDDQQAMGHILPRRYLVSRTQSTLGIGRHRYMLLYFQASGRLGLAATWRRVGVSSADYMPAIRLHDVGQNGQGVRFLPSAKCTS